LNELKTKSRESLINNGLFNRCIAEAKNLSYRGRNQRGWFPIAEVIEAFQRTKPLIKFLSEKVKQMLAKDENFYDAGQQFVKCLR